MNKSIRELAAEKVAEIEAANQQACEQWLTDTFDGLTCKDFENEGWEAVVSNSDLPYLQIKYPDGKWSEPLRSWMDLYEFFQAHDRKAALAKR